MSCLHERESKKFYCLGAELAFVQVDLHAGLLETLEDFVENTQVFVKILSFAMEDIVDVWIGFVCQLILF